MSLTTKNQRKLIKEAAKTYIARGWPVVPCTKDKRPISKKGWQNATYTVEVCEQYPSIGLKLSGSEVNDIDLDMEPARILGGLLLGALPAFGRNGQVPGHRLFKSSNAPDTIRRFQLPKRTTDALGIPSSTIVEIRCGKGQTVCPPSLYANGDQCEWTGGLPEVLPELDFAEVEKTISLLAALTVFWLAYPEEGARDDYCMRIAGVLCHAGFEDMDLGDSILEAIAKGNGDSDWSTRGKFSQSLTRYQGGESVTGLPKLVEEFGLETCEAKLREWLGLMKQSTSASVTRDSIDIDGTDLADLVERSFQVLRGTEIYRSEIGRLCRVRVLPESTESGGLKRHSGLAEIVEAEVRWIQIQLSKYGSFHKRRGRTPAPCAPTREVAEWLRASSEEAPFPVLRGVSMVPGLRRSAPGYDPASGIFYHFDKDAFPEIRESPTFEQRKEALDRLMQPFRYYPFKDEASKSVVASAILCSLVAPELPAVPLHAFVAPLAGSGKTKIAECIGIISTGLPPSMLMYSGRRDEDEKRLATVLRYGDPVLCYDNVDRVVEGDLLCAAITGSSLQTRILGATERVEMDARVLFLLTGNNVPFKGDICRRVLTCRICPSEENPHERKFDFDPVEMVRRSRGQMVADGLTVLRNVPDLDLKAFGSFDGYRVVRRALVSLGMADPHQTVEQAESGDLDRLDLRELQQVWWAQFGSDRKRARDAFEVEELRDICGSKSPKGLGRWLSRRTDIPCDGYVLRSADRSGTKQFWLELRKDDF
jgi:hypothetical protein